MHLQKGGGEKNDQNAQYISLPCGSGAGSTIYIPALLFRGRQQRGRQGRQHKDFQGSAYAVQFTPGQEKKSFYFETVFDKRISKNKQLDERVVSQGLPHFLKIISIFKDTNIFFNMSNQHPTLVAPVSKLTTIMVPFSRNDKFNR